MNYNLLLSKIIILACISYTSPSQSHQEEANERANAGSLKAIGNIPRSGDDSELDMDDFSDPKPYLTGIVSYVRCLLPNT